MICRQQIQNVKGFFVFRTGGVESTVVGLVVVAGFFLDRMIKSSTTFTVSALEFTLLETNLFVSGWGFAIALEVSALAAIPTFCRKEVHVVEVLRYETSRSSSESFAAVVVEVDD